MYLAFHSSKRALWLVGSWSRAPDQIQIYPDQQRRLLSDWLIVLLVPRFFHAPVREITNKMAAKDVLFDYLL